ncbi:MAG TPA: hypothetical protein VI933_01375 [archaeon]|nr:hypothetical protein [archaeon]
MPNNTLFSKKSISKGMTDGLKALGNYCRSYGAGMDDVLSLTDFGEVCYDVTGDDRRLYLRTQFFDLYFYFETKRRKQTLLPSEVRKLASPATPYEFICRLAPVRVNDEEIQKRVNDGIFFQPFGIAKDGIFDDRCKSAISFTENILRYLKKYGIDAELVLMPADAYAIDINGYSEDAVKRFISDMKDFCGRTSTPRVKVVEWSKIREENRNRYEEITSGFSMDNSLLDKLLERAKRFSNLLPAESARRYASERFAEAIIIDETLKPIKISAANTDVDELDENLPRIYPEKIQRFPWLPPWSKRAD